MKIRSADDRGFVDLGWLKSRHTFSFADYYDPKHMNYGHLRVINDDYIAAGRGFGTHPHRDMEIITYMLDGALEHRDSMGNGSVIRPGEVQRLTAGTGITHSEHNPLQDQEAHLLQIWIVPDRGGYVPGYQQIEFDEADKRGKLRLIASRNGDQGSVSINQDVNLYAALLTGPESIRHQLPSDKKAWVQMARGGLKLNGQQLSEGDGAAIEAGAELVFEEGDNAEFLLFEMEAAA